MCSKHLFGLGFVLVVSHLVALPLRLSTEKSASIFHGDGSSGEQLRSEPRTKTDEGDVNYLD